MMIGCTLPVLFEASLDGGKMVGWSDNYVRVGIEPDFSLVNHLLPVRILGTNGQLCFGEPAQEDHTSTGPAFPSMTRIIADVGGAS